MEPTEVLQQTDTLLTNHGFAVTVAIGFFLLFAGLTVLIVKWFLGAFSKSLDSRLNALLRSVSLLTVCLYHVKEQLADLALMQAGFSQHELSGESENRAVLLLQEVKRQLKEEREKYQTLKEDNDDGDLASNSAS